MEILEEQLLSLQQHESTKHEDELPEPTVISRRQAELEAANDRLQRTAQNFSLEWKSFLGYAMKIKQQRANGATAVPLAGEKDLEDLLLKTQGGLVLLRDLPNRRDRQWTEVLERYGYQHPSLAAKREADEDSDHEPVKPAAPAPRCLCTLISKLLLLNQQVASTAHCAVNRLPFTPEPALELAALVKQRAVALETHHRLKYVQDSGSDKQTPAAIDGLVKLEDVTFLLQFNHMKNQQAVVLERVCTRLKWLSVSHRFHLRQRMLALVHQQKVKNTPRPSAATKCPLFILTAAQLAAELKLLAHKHSLVMPDALDDVDAYQPFRQAADNVLTSTAASFPLDNAINSDGSLERGLETLVHSYTRSSRWELLQRGHLGNCEPGPGHIEERLVALRNDHKVDSLLANEWELLTLDDVGYLRVRLEALSRAHLNRATVHVATSKPAAAGDALLEENQGLFKEDGNEHGECFSQRKAGSLHSWHPDALYSLYVMRVVSCRAQRLRLLRVLNYLHFVQLSHSQERIRTSNDSPREKSVSSEPPEAWRVTKCESTGDLVIHRQTPRAEEGDGDDKSRGHEFIFTAARRDLEALELQMLRTASIFVFKQEYESLPTSPRRRSSDGQDSDTVVNTIDRLQVLRDAYDCEVAFQQAKLQLVERLLDGGLRYAPRRRDFLELGLPAQAEPFAELLFPALQRRPLIDFSHAYFFESYAAETLLLELQASLVQQSQQHSQRLQWCSSQDFAFGDASKSDDEQRHWACRQILGASALVRVHSQQQELLRDADDKWFTATSVGEFHALQHALLEQTLVTWSLITKLELSGRPVRCLERTAGDLLSGCGWQLVLPPQLLADVCRSLHDEATAVATTARSPTLVEWLAKALELEEWRQQLAQSVYEAHLLERVHHFQFGFVKQLAALDTVVGGEQARHLAFFFDCSECDRVGALRPLAVELETPLFQATNAAPAPRYSALRSDDSKAVSEWLQAQLSSSDDDVATQAKRSGRWRRSLLLLQQQYVSHLEVVARYQDAVGADVFEFAASFPYVCLANSLAPESSSSPDDSSMLAMDINTVRAKYAKEIADKMTDEMRTSCFQYWKRLENLKQQLQERFATSASQLGDGLKAAFASLQPSSRLEVDTVACGHFLSEESCHPRLLTTLNSHLQGLRNEKRLMQQLSPAARARCAFACPPTPSDRTPQEAHSDEPQPSRLTKWLMVKLHQLKVDLQIHERPKVEQLLLTPPASCASPSQRATRGYGRPPPEPPSSEMHTLLQAIPSFRSLLHTFAMTGSYERTPRDSSGGAASAHASRLSEHREETLRTLVTVFRQLSCTLGMLRIRCGSRFAATRHTAMVNGERHFPTGTAPQSTTRGAFTGLGRLERWQTLFHHEIRQLLDHITSDLSLEAALATSELFETQPENLQNQHNASRLRHEFHSALQEANAHSARMLRCTSTFALLQTYHKNAGVRVRKRRQQLLSFQCLLKTLLQSQQHQRTLTSGEDESTVTMARLVQAAEQALFGEARPQDREREWQAFKDAVGKYEARDSACIDLMTGLLEMHWVYIDENCRVLLRLAEEAAVPSLTSQCLAENQALAALEDLWERFHLPAWDSLLGDEAAVRSAAPVVGGENLHLKKRLLGAADVGTGTSPSSGSAALSSPKELSIALRSLQMGATPALSQFCSTGLLVLPPPSSIGDQVAYLQLSIELAWVNADMKELEDQFSTFLCHRKSHREHQRTPNFTARKPPRNPQTPAGSACATSSSLLLALGKYFHDEGLPADQAQPPETPQPADGVRPLRRPKKLASAAAFVVPVEDMARFLHGITTQCVEHSKQQLELHNSSIQQLQSRCQAAALERHKTEEQWAKAKAEERIRREAFAVDHAFHLYFEVEALRKQLSVLEARRELDQQVLRCELNAEYDEKLRVMHAELLNKQHKFAEYRTAMQRELQTVVQGAHSQFVDQLLDFSGTLPSTTKSSVSALLRGQQDVVRIKSENAAMKQALLKVQALGDMQQQTQAAARERELLLTQRFATAEALQRDQVEQLQTYVKQLESNMSKLSQEKTFFQVKWTTAQTQMEAAAQQRREAKVRALSASSAWKTPDADDQVLPAVVPAVANASETESSTDVSTARPGTAVSAVDAEGKQERQYLNSVRHYQNEIRRLQQQVTREIREKAAMGEQLTQLRQYESAASIQPRDVLLPFVEDPRTPRALGEETLRRDSATPRRTQSASPSSSRLRPQSCVAAPPDRTATPRRPNSSFSPRASLLRAQVAVGSGSHPPVLEPCAPGSRPSTASSNAGTPARKFQVVKRETNAVGGVAGVSNSLSVREPLPYR